MSDEALVMNRVAVDTRWFDLDFAMLCTPKVEPGEASAIAIAYILYENFGF